MLQLSLGGQVGIKLRRFRFSRREIVCSPLTEIQDPFFFRNIPDDCSLAFLREKFGEVGTVLDVFCPNKWDMRGKRFGFVRFPETQTSDMDKMLRALNSLWIGSYKIQVYLPKFRRPQMYTKSQAVSSFEAGKGKRLPGVSYREVVSKEPGTLGGPNLRVEMASEEKHKRPCQDDPEPKMEKVRGGLSEISFETREEEKEWLKSCLVGLLRKDFLWEEIVDEIQGEWGTRVKLIYVGDNVVLIQNLSNSTMEEFWFQYWFEWWRPWKPEDVCHWRRVWTRWIGVPLHVWNHRFFSFISFKVGNFIRFDPQSERMARGDVIRALFSVPYLEEINQSFQIRIDGIMYSMRVLEEIPCTSECKEIFEKEVGDDDGSDWSEGREAQCSFGPTEAVEYDEEDSSDDGSEGNIPINGNSCVRTESEEVGGGYSNGQKSGKVNSLMSVWSRDCGGQGFSEFNGHGSVLGDGLVGRGKSPGLEESELIGAVDNNGPIISGPKFFSKQNLEGEGPVNAGSPGNCFSDPEGAGEKINKALSNNINNLTLEPTKLKVGEDSVSNSSLRVIRAGSGENMAKENQQRKREKSVSKNEKRAEGKKKWRAFVSDLETSADREAETRNLKHNGRGKGEGNAKDEKRQEAAKTWELGKKLGLTSVVHDDRMISEVEALDRSKGNDAEEPGRSNKVSNQ